MATTGNTNNQTKYFSSGSISLKAIRDTFGGNNNSIKFSKYYRKTDKDITTAEFGKESSGHFVPDASENDTIGTSGTISFSDFRGEGDDGVIKDYVVTQTGANSKYLLSSGASTTWNDNLARNVPKTGRISGRVFSTTQGNGSSNSNYNHTSHAALRFSAEAYNLDIDIDSDTSSDPASANNSNNGPRGVFGVGGNVGKTGGTAASIIQNSNRSGTSAIINVNLGNGRLFAGGGGGSNGNAGNSGNNGNSGNKASCNFKSSKSFNVHNGSGLNFRGNSACNNTSSGCGSQNIGGIGGNVISGNCSGSRNRKRCRNSKGGNRSRGESICFGTINKSCTFSHNFSGNSAPGGNAGNGGNAGSGAKGQGSTNISVNDGKTSGNSGNSGNSGSCSNCNSVGGYSVSQSGGNCGNPGNSGNSGNAGNSGGKYGKPSAGAGGFAVFSNTKSQVKVNNSSKAKGSLTNVTT